MITQALIPAGRRCLAVFAAGLGGSLAGLHAAEQLSTAAIIQFSRDVQPIFKERCYSCHGPDKQKSGFRLDQKAGAIRGGDDGVAIVAGSSGASPLVKLVEGADPDRIMPPEGGKLNADQIALLKAWIDQGAAWPDDGSEVDKRLLHWAYQAVARPPVPQPSGISFENPIDGFLASRLAQHEIVSSPAADRRTLIRRLSFDLLGLPPSPEEAEAFVRDPDPRAYEKLVDRYLESPRHGERWARHWLDIAHYADTHGFERDQKRENAWRYRDYVIRSLNDDKPYDRFLREQIAGDVIAPDDPDANVATGFLAAGPWDFVGQVETKSDVLKRAARADDLDDMVTQVMTAACATTINCARCHDHKLDPISQQEYYSLWAVFAGVKRGDREVDPAQAGKLRIERNQIARELAAVKASLFRLRGGGLNLADIVGGGDGSGTGTKGQGIDPRTGLVKKDKAGFLANVEPNKFSKTGNRLVDGVVIPDGGESRVPVVITSTGIPATGIPDTSAAAWDAIRNGPVSAQKSTVLHGIDFAGEGHSMIALHANAAITFDLQAIRGVAGPRPLRLHAEVGYGGRPGGGMRTMADARVFVDGALVFEKTRMGPDDHATIAVELPTERRFLTLMATDGGDGIGHDQVFFGDPMLQVVEKAGLSRDQLAEVSSLESQQDRLERRLRKLPEPSRVYAVVPEQPQIIRVLRRGDPEQPKDEVKPGAVQCFGGANFTFGDHTVAEGERRRRLAEWVVDVQNPLTRRVIVNRLWHHHFGTGIVDTPSDFGLGGGKPSHPELLDWLADELVHSGWSLKHMHRLMVTSQAYRRISESSVADLPRAQRRNMQIDASNRLLWRMNPRRLDAESMRDAVLAVTGCLNLAMAGPGYQDFAYQEAYAPIYDYVTPDNPGLWRRSIYRFVVRSTLHPFMTTLDCPNPANLAPARLVTTTPLQSLALMNNDFMLQQSAHFARRVQREAGNGTDHQVDRAFALAFQRLPVPGEKTAALQLVGRDGLVALCRALLNANEFVYVD